MRAPVTTIVFGPSGQLGSRILRAIPGSIGISTHLVEREGLEPILAPLPHGPIDCVLANGSTDPKRTREELFAANFEFPRRVFEALKGRETRLLTLGTVHENFPELTEANPYFASKKALSDWVRSIAASHPKRVRHVRLHTVYSEDLRPHMFLGQMVESLIQREPFLMTTGTQLREYHHADDITEALVGIMRQDWTGEPIVELHSGEPIRLVELAQAVFAACDAPGLLRVGALGESARENWNRTFERSSVEFLPYTRPSIAGVIAAARAAIKKKQALQDRSPTPR